MTEGRNERHEAEARKEEMKEEYGLLKLGKSGNEQEIWGQKEGVFLLLTKDSRFIKWLGDSPPI